MMKIIIPVCIAVVGLFGCGEKIDPILADDNSLGDGDAGDDAGQTGQREVMYTSPQVTIKSILDMYCISCHATTITGTDRNSAPPTINYDTYEAARANASAANSEIQSGGMPPSGNGLTPEEKRLFQLWIDTGLNK